MKHIPLKSREWEKIKRFLAWSVISFICQSLMLSSPVLAQEEPSEKTPQKNLLTNEFSIFYQNSLHIYQQNEIQLKGWQENQIQASAQLRLNPALLLRASMMGDRSDIELTDFKYNPIFTTDSFWGEVSLNYLSYQNASIAWANGLSYLLYQYTPDNLNQYGQPIPYTNSHLDLKHQLQGPGLYSIANIQIFDPLSLMVQASFYPYFFASVPKGMPLNYVMLGKAQFQLRYQLLDGFLSVLYFRQEIWAGDFQKSNSTLGIGLTLVPEHISEN